MPNPGSPYKDSLQLSVGVGLSAEQVAALTHDIVWLEEAEVNGEKVLVPVLYLAQAENRLAPTGALIQGQDVTLISGGALNNAGTLRASNNLSASASNLSNSGLIQAGNRLDLLADDSIRNAAGGIIAGRDVSLTALTGDVINERSVTRIDSAQSANRTWTTSFADSAARIEAANSLDISAGRDVSNLGGVLQSRGDLFIGADRDVNIASVEVTNGQLNGRRYYSETTTQLGAEASAGRDLDISAGRDLNAVASRLDAARDAALSAGRDVTLASAADESHSYSNTRKTKSKNDRVEQQSTVLTAGGDVSLYAGQDLGVIGSQVKGGANVALDAERDVAIVATQNEQYAYLYKKKEGSFGKSKTKTSESYAEANVDSVIQAGKDLTVNISKAEDGGIRLNGGRDLVVAGSQLQAGNDLMLGATRDIAILATEQDQASASGKSKSSAFGVSKMKEVRNSASTEQVGSILQGGSDTVLVAGRNVDVNASRIGAGRDVELHAGKLDATGDINIVAGSDSSSSYAEKQRSKWGISNSGNFVSINTASKAGNTSEQTVNAPSEIAAGRDVRMTSARDINVVGSNIAAERTVGMQADRDVNILPGESTSSAKDWDKKRQTGLGWKAEETTGVAYLGIDWNAEHGKQVDTAAAGSQVRAGEDLDIRAGRDIRQQGSDLDAGRDIRLVAGRDIVSDAGQDTSEQERVKRHQRASIGVQGSQSISTGIQNFGHLGDGETVFGKVSSVLKTIDGTSDAGASASIYVGANQEQSNGEAQQYDARNSTLNAGRDIIAQAGRDITLQGTQADAGRNIVLDAGRDLSIQSSQSNYRSKDHSDSVSGSVGIGVGNYNVASQQGSSSIGSNSSGTNTSNSGIYGAGSVAWNNQEQNGSRQNNAHLNAGGDIDLRSGRDTLIAGATVEGGGVKIDVGRDLTVASVRDQDRIEGNGQSHSGSGGFGGGSGAISVSKTDGKRNWVGEQTRIQGRDSVDIYTEGHTQLDGAVIASNTGDLLLNTGTFGHSDLYDKDRYKSVDITSGMAYNSKENQDKGKTTNDQAQVPNKFIAGSYDIRNAEQVNRATVGAGEIVVRDNPGQDLSGLNRDTDKAQELLKDEHKGEDLYLSSNSVERAGYIAETVGNAVPAFVEGLQQAQNRKELTTGTPDERYAAAGRLLDSYGAEKLPAEVRQGLSEQIGQLAIKDPQAAAAATEIMHRLLGQDAMKQNFAQVLLEGGLAAALGAALIATTPQAQEAWAKVAPELSSSVREDVQKLALYLILLQPGSPVSPTDLRFPIFQPDSLPLVTPSVDPTLWKPGSGGYGADGKVDTSVSTGGSEIHENNGSINTSPAGPVPSPGAMISETSTPSGRTLTDHAVESLTRHGFKDLQQVDDVINNSTHTITQLDGATVYVQKNGSGSKARYNIVVEGEGGIVTGMRNFKKFEVEKMARNQGWESLPF
ncbi:hemagglutinin repeat-containing protein [Pseudomonas sp. PDM22]|uniref:hemagglutinin repeat-containing protein n=1 Tax=Pseudomonas sp. PDM22 TaxID=2769287 RepID=UPI001CE0E7FF|nr:hemagglutinin repeat-containing protein [Pseudomonas sp. PDM22]